MKNDPALGLYYISAIVITLLVGFLCVKILVNLDRSEWRFAPILLSLITPLILLLDWHEQILAWRTNQLDLREPILHAKPWTWDHWSLWLAFVAIILMIAFTGYFVRRSSRF